MAEAAPVVIVGGGITGLSAARTLARRGVAFRLLEAGPRFGGVIRTEVASGFLLEAGPDAILAQKPEGIALCRELGLADRLIPTNPEERTVFVLRGGRLHPLPEGMVLAIPTRFAPLLRSGLFSLTGKLRMGLDLVVRRKKDPQDESMAAFLRRRFGREAVDRLGEPLMAGIHAGDPERLSIQATFPRFVEMEKLHGSLIRGMLATRPRGRPGPAPTAFYSLKGGLQELLDALVSCLPSGALCTKTPVERVELVPSGYAVHIPGGALAARTLILAVPPNRAAALLRGPAPDVAEALAQVPFASTATVLLGYRREDVRHPLNGYGMVIPRNEGLHSSACTFFSTKFPGRAPDRHVLLRGFLGGIRDPEVLSLSDEALAATFQREMTSILGITGQPSMTRVFRWPHATPQMEVGHLERMDVVERRLAGFPGLFLAGAGYRVTGIPDCVADGAQVAASAADVHGRSAA